MSTRTLLDRPAWATGRLAEVPPTKLPPPGGPKKLAPPKPETPDAA